MHYIIPICSADSAYLPCGSSWTRRCVLDSWRKWLKQLFPAFKDSRNDYEFFYEVKANLTREQIRGLYLGGVREIQPGIESLSSNVLKLMRKGSTMLQNVRLLKWCRYYGIDVGWNLIWGFPGETEDDYSLQLDVMRRISHLQPPASGGRIWLERYAPYYEERELFGLSDVEPESSYGHVYPPWVNLDSVAYFFTYTMAGAIADEVYEPIQQWLPEWRKRWSSNQPDQLVFRRTPDALFIEDRRGNGPGQRCVVEGAWAIAFDICSETMHSVAQVCEQLHTHSDYATIDKSQVSAILEDFVARGLMLTDQGQYLSLALPVNPNW